MPAQALPPVCRPTLQPTDWRPPSFPRPARATRLGGFALFEGLDPEALRELDTVTQLRVVDKGGFVFLPGDDSGSVYFLSSGRVKVSGLTEEGKEFILDLVEPGQLFGETGVLDGGPRETMAQALERSTLLSVPAGRLRQLLDRNPTILMRLLAILGARQKWLGKRLVDLAHKNACRRLADLLLELSRRYGVRDPMGIVLRIKLSQSALGSLIGVSRERVNQAVSDLRRRGILGVSGGWMVIQKPEALHGNGRPSSSAGPNRLASARWVQKASSPRSETPSC